ncbi:DoxX family protein [Kitasatospora acidiphila]|uniref:DoxX family protein n=1 Tax=Kitasatospora acidiphila TaxID=2567942 RepID=A0A540W1R2_9ACTN|nr:DoxX family protein [Kitasatospora acidiphila]TQF02968.1 DoxX family protein [Kitasatospora acidiphila]
MNLALWIAAGLLALVALAGGVSKTFVPKAKLAKAHGGEWAGDAGTGFVKTPGILELLAAVGLVAPAALHIAPAMVPVTAVCWVLLMVGAIITHRRYDGQAKFVALNLSYLVLAAFIALGRS